MKKVLIAAAIVGAAFATSCTNKNATGVTEGSLSKFDTLSYAVGMQLSTMATSQLKEIPVDFDVLVESMNDAAFGKNDVTPEAALETIQDYFMNKRAPRAAAVKAERDSADSVALANGADAAAVAEARANLAAAESMFESAEERTAFSTALGVNLGNSIVMSKIPAQMTWVREAFKDVEADGFKLDENTANAKVQEFFTVTMPTQNREASEAWLAETEKKSGVQKTESGILYKIESAGDESVKAFDDRDVVKVKYTGKTRDGKVFDSSRFDDMEEARLEYMKSQAENGELTDEMEIIEFPLNRVIPGWTEGMKLVGKGGRISLWLPSDLAYGERGAGAAIGANEALYFDVELIDVIPFEEPAATQAE